jgi:putative hydrolase of the HAD superfamily
MWFTPSAVCSQVHSAVSRGPSHAHHPEDYGMTTRFSAVFFDAANTLVHPKPPVGELYAQTARNYGVDVSAADVQAEFRRSWETLQAKAVGDPVRYGIGEADGRRWWHALVAETFRPLGTPQPFDMFFDELYTLFARPDVWHVFPDVRDVLQALKARGLITGVISNWDIRLGPLLEGLGLKPYFDHVVLSAVVGWEKPHPRIFESALELAGVPADRVLHVGDNYQQDVVGARQVGMYAVWLRRRGVQQADCPVIGSLGELLPMVDGPMASA